jgi:hypothetical protein
MTNYRIEITFQSDRDLSANELSNLEGHLMLQIDEPYDQNSEPETYASKDATYKMERIN